MNTWRLLKLEARNAFMNMAVDEAILIARGDNKVPDTLRLYRWKPSAVSVGKFQIVENEVQLDNCREYGVDVVRRITVGGAVYHDAEDEITYSVIASKKKLKAESITSVYVKIYAGMAEALKILGISANLNEGTAKTCPNLTVHGKKISGSAQSHKKGVVLQHGTLLLDVDLKRMFTFLRVPWAKTCIEVLPVAKDKLTSVKRELRANVSMEAIEHALVEGYQKALNVELVTGKLTTYEHNFAKKFFEEKYITEDWNLHGKG